jgi:predicted Zn finger-like uncharacterized protein
MPEPSQCPSCNAKVRVPEHMLGKKVRCPKCQSTFTAGAEEPEEPAESEGVVTEPTPSRRRRAVPVEEPDEKESAPDEDEDRPRKRRRPRGRGRGFDEAAAAVTAPAICMMVFGGLNIAVLLLDLAGRFLNFGLVAAGPGGPAPPAEDYAVGVVLGAIGDVVGIALAAFLIYGGVKLKQLNNYGLVMGASICTFLPCFWLCCFLGIPLGIWTLITINKPEIKAAFT